MGGIRVTTLQNLNVNNRAINLLNKLYFRLALACLSIKQASMQNGYIFFLFVIEPFCTTKDTERKFQLIHGKASNLNPGDKHCPGKFEEHNPK